MTAFLSDNVSGMHPAVAAAIMEADRGYFAPYGDDELSQRLDQTYSELFETAVAVVPCVTGTAANSIAIALLARSFNGVCVYADSHIYLDECSGPEFFSGGARQIPVGGTEGKMDADRLRAAMAAIGERHSPQPSAISVAQATETGTLYGPGELRRLAGIAHQHGLKVHMDGARFANAVAGLDCEPADISWKAGIDVLSFGATKNGCLAAEAIVLFDTSLLSETRYRAKQAGQMLSKHRYLAAQLLAYVEDGLWLDNARHANRQAEVLAARLAALDGVEVLPRDVTNMLYVMVPDRQLAALQAAGAAGHVYGDGSMRLVCSWATTDQDIDRFIGLLSP